MTLEAKDQEAADGKIISRGSELFKKQEVKQKGEQYRRYMELISQNRLLMDLDWVKTNLEQAYLKQTSEEMKLYIEEIINYCEGTENKHFIWFARLLRNHIDGIISHAEYPLSNGKVEGINQKIKTIGNKTKNDNGRNDHIQLKHLCAVNDQITKSLSGSEKLADDNAD